MSRVEDRSNKPRAMIHRRILDVANNMPDASLTEIANEVSGASAELVDSVLAEYGDPSDEPLDKPEDEGDPDAESADTGDGDADTAVTGDRTDPTTSDLSERQQETLGLIARNPNATQRELGAELDVTAATVSRWVNDIPSFDWNDREAFTERVFDDVSENTADGSTTGSADDMDDAVGSDGDSTDTAETPAGDTVEETEDDTESSQAEGYDEDDVDGGAEVADLRRRVGVLEDRFEGQSGDEGPGETDRERDETSSDQIDTELLHKVVHACMDSERITDKEEIRLLDHLLR